MIRYGICNLSLVPCRAEPSDKSEIVTQLLFGEHFEVIARERNWIYIRIAADQYECWIDEKQHQPVSAETFRELSATIQPLASDMIQLLTHRETGLSFPVTMGCSLPYLNNGICNLQGEEYLYEGSVVKPDKPAVERMTETAMMFLNAPYLWGGKTVFGIDCSGFVQLIYKMCGISLPRDASQQSTVGTVLSFLEEAEEGDLAFFDNQQGRIIHTGIILKDQRIIHASGKVRIDKLDHYGIYNEEKKEYTHHLRLIRAIGKV